MKYLQTVRDTTTPNASYLLSAALSELEALQEDISTIIMPDFDTESFSRLADYLYGGLDAEGDDCRHGSFGNLFIYNEFDDEGWTFSVKQWDIIKRRESV